MNDFAWTSPTQFVFGRDAEEKIGPWAASAGARRANSAVKSKARTSRTPHALIAATRESKSIRRRGARSGATTDSGWFLNVSATSAPDRIALCPRWTPSKKPTATVILRKP